MTGTDGALARLTELVRARAATEPRDPERVRRLTALLAQHRLDKARALADARAAREAGAP